MSLHLIVPTIGLDNRGGTRVYIELANILSQRGHRVTMLVPRGANTTTFHINPEVTLKSVGFKIPQIEDISSIVRLMMLFPLLDECDVMLANYYLTSFPVAFASLFRRARLCVNLIQHYEPLAFGEAEKTFPQLKKWLAATSYRFAMEQVAVAAWIAKRVSRISKRKVHVFYPNIDLSVFRGPDTQIVREEKSILAFPGKDVWKGWHDFVAAFALLKKSDPMLKVIAASRFSYPLPAGPFLSVHPKSDQELVRLYQTANVYVHPSWWEGCPLAPLEAMACGTPVVAAASEGILEYAVDGENCVLVPAQSPAELAAALGRVLGDAQLRTRITEGGYATVQRFGWPKMADQFEALLLSACS
jgi:glycosyltransferase involved in cell wall biosynthesis